MAAEGTGLGVAMRHIVATLIVITLLVLVSGSVEVHGQASCTFVAGFARLRELVGADKVGQCLEDEHFNVDNGNAEQQTTGGLMVWRKVDNFTAFTDGGTTWVNGPDGLQSRPNNERFSWESDPVTTGSSSGGAVPVAAAPAAATPTPTPIPLPSPSPSTAGSSTTTSAGTTSAAVAAASPAATPTKAATPTPVLTAKFTDKPDSVDTGSDAEFHVDTSAEKGVCVLYVTYKGKDETPVTQADIEDGKCEMKYTVAADAKTGQAKARVAVVSKDPKEGQVSIDDDFDVNKGDSTLAGDIDIQLEADDLPDDASVGEEIKIAIHTNYKNRGQCELTIAWPKYTSVAGDVQTPNGDGKCSWKMTVPTEIPKKGTATLTVVVRKSKNSSTLRQLTKEFDVKK